MADLTTEYNRIVNAKESIKTAINNKGGTLTNERIHQYASAIDNITTSGFNGEEIIGIAGEALSKGDIVGLFNEPNLIQNLTNFDITGRFYFDNGNKYYKMEDYIKIYSTETDELLETRIKPTNCYGCNNFEQPDIDYLCYYESSTTKNLIIYKWDATNNEYFVARTFTELELRADSAGTNNRITAETCQNPCNMKDYLCFLSSYKTSSSYYPVYAKIINKLDFSITSMLIYGSSKNSAYGQEAICDYYRNRVLFCLGNHQGKDGMSTQRLRYYDVDKNETIHSASLYVGASSKVYFYLNGGNGLIAINSTTSSYNSANSYRGVYMVNDNGQVYNIDQYNPPYWFVSASSDFNEVVFLNQTDLNYYLANVALKTLTQITDPTKIPNYYQPRSNNSHLMPVKENGAVKVIMRNQVEFASKIAKVTGFTSSFRKVVHPANGLYTFLGVVKEDAIKGTTVTVNKIIDY